MQTILRLIPLIYLLRVPMLVWAAQMALLAGIYFSDGVRSLLGGMLELRAGGVVVVTTLALLLAAVETISAELVLRYGQSRFGLPSFPAFWEQPIRFGDPQARGLKLEIKTATAPFLCIFLLGAIILIAAILVESLPAWPLRILLAFAGLLLAGLLLWTTSRLWTRLVSSPRAYSLLLALLQRVLPWTQMDPLGYRRFHEENGELVFENRLLLGHVFASCLAFLWLCVYATLGVAGYPAFSNPFLRFIAAPALGSVLILLTVLCLGFSALAFWLDRHRLPALSPVLLVALVSSFFLRSDHTFETTSRRDFRPLNPQQVVAATSLPSPRGFIVVTASGGGIHAAAWTTKVLSELTRLCAGTTSKLDPGAFPRAIRLISSVSGGSLGSLYFSAAYQNGEIPLGQLDKAVIEPAQSSSLDQVSWGIVYPDLLRLALLVPSSLNSGWALEKAWAHHVPLPARFADWRADVAAGKRPAQIFNSTLVETGERSMLGTVDIALPKDTKARDVSFYGLYEDLDLPAVTAARVSSTFPYVTPASRPEGAPADTTSYHAVDGGYYDNFGVMSATQFLLQSVPQPSIDRVLLIQIDGGPPSDDDRKPTQRGWFFQTFAPVQTLIKVRSSSQRARNDVDLQLLSEVLAARRVQLTTARFSCPKGDHPLSWHLTEDQKKHIRSAWGEIDQAEKDKVISFMQKIQSSPSPTSSLPQTQPHPAPPSSPLPPSPKTRDPGTTP